jgi:conjugative transfer pilus assembly protein TraH
MKLKTMVFYLSLVISSYFLFSTVIYANINNDLDSYFTSLGYSSNTTSPHAYHGQQAGYYTGGSTSMRTQVRDVQIVQLNLPSYRSGCGGIDIYAGSFSLIDAAEMKQVLQNTLNSGGAYAFTLALETASPVIENTMNKWNDFRNKLNQASLNSCETSEALVGGMWPRVRGAQQRVCEDVGSSSNYFSDWAQARQGCGAGGDFDRAIKSGKNDARYKDLIIDNGNVVWKAIQHRSFLQRDSDLAELFMSLSGTVVLYKDGNSMQHLSYPALVDNDHLVKALLTGGKATIYSCDTTDTDGCLHPKTDKVINISENNAFKSRVENLLRDITKKIVTDTPITEEEQGLLKATAFPAYKILTVQAAYMKDGNLPDVEQLADVVASDVLYAYLHESLAIIKSSVAALPFPDAIIAEIEPNIDKQMAMLAAQRKTAYSQLAVSIQFIEQTQAIERMLAGDFSTQFASTLSWAKGLR